MYGNKVKLWERVFIINHLWDTLDKQNALASLRKWTLIQDNSGPYRVYRDEKNNVYHSVTHILKETAPQHTKDALENWLKRSDSPLWSVILLAKEASSHTLTQSLYSNLQQNLQDKTQTSEVYGGLVIGWTGTLSEKSHAVGLTKSS